MQNLSKKTSFKQSIEIQHQHADVEKFGQKKVPKFQNFHIIATGEHHKSYREAIQ